MRSPSCSTRTGSLVTRSQAAGGGGKSVEDVLREANALLENLSGGGALPPSLQASIDELQEMGYVCDESGCVLMMPGDDPLAAGPPPIARLLTGPNWALGMLDPASSDADDADEDAHAAAAAGGAGAGGGASPYAALVAGPCWQVPLKPAELADFCGMLAQLRGMVADLAQQGQWSGGSPDRPASRVKWETNHIVLKAAYAPTAPGFSIEMTFRTSGRSVTTHWPPEVAAAVIAAVDAEMGTGAAGVGAAAQVQRPAAVSA